MTISIHALREEGDKQHDEHRRKQQHFYPRPPRGGRPIAQTLKKNIRSFLSTPSARRATRTQKSGTNGLEIFLSTPSARRATADRRHKKRQGKISIHALREEGDPNFCLISSGSRSFLSTPSARRATPLAHSDRRKAEISIHALREEGDPLPMWSTCTAFYFYPRPPRGGRLSRQYIFQVHSSTDFYPRPPRGGRRYVSQLIIFYPSISIHALREEGDPPPWAKPAQKSAFLSTPSARRAT